MNWSLRSPAFDSGTPIPVRHTGDGEDLSPPLLWAEPPRGTRELALVVDDPDAPSKDPWVHWVLYKISAATRELPAGIAAVRSVPGPTAALQGKNSWGSIGWRGPSPPRGHGVHHYRLHLYALDAPLALDAGMEAKALQGALAGHVLAQAELIGTYQR